MDHSCTEALMGEEGPAGGYSTPPHPMPRPFHFPPPPPYPPPGGHLLLPPEDTAAAADYSYAYNAAPHYAAPQYYQHHHHIHHQLQHPQQQPSTASAPHYFHHPYIGGSRGRDKHTFISTYGVEENIYEEICEARDAFENPEEFATPDDAPCGPTGGRKRGARAEAGGQPPRASRSRTVRRLTEEELMKVQQGHRRVLGELNLAVEAMLMPNGQCEDGPCCGPPSADEDDVAEEERLLLLSASSAGASDDLLSPDSGFHSGSSGSVASCSKAPVGRPPPTRSRGTPPPPPPPEARRRCPHPCGGRRAPDTDAGPPPHRPGVPSPLGRHPWAEQRHPWAKKKGDPLGLFAKSWRIPGFGGPHKGDEPRGLSWDERDQLADESALPEGPRPSRPPQRRPEGGEGIVGDPGPGPPPPPLARGGSGRGRIDPAAAAFRQVSSETDSWGSAESDLSSSSEDDEDANGSSLERSAALSNGAAGSIASRAGGNLRSTLNKARTLCDKWRESRGRGALPSGPTDAAAPEGRLARWFSIRRNQYDVDSRGGGCRDAASVGASPALASPAAAAAAPQGGQPLLLDVSLGGGGTMPLLLEEEEAGGPHNGPLDCVDRPRAMTFAAGGDKASPTDVSAAFPPFPAYQRRQQPPALPPPPPGLTPEQIKRRHIVAAIVHSENSYVATLQRLANDYKKPLEESNPPILSAPKIATLFHRVQEILQCHTLFRIALTESVRNWDREEALGDVFVASFSKAVVLEIYSDFINNFSIAMDLAKQESKRKSALADFLKVKQISAHDRLSFFGLMVKPVQRFPQFILFLQDLLKHTPQGHHDRMSLQLALTQLESLAEMLNERKREAEQYQAFREMLRHVGGKFAARPLVSDGAGRYLLREDNVTQLEFNQSGMITKAKRRRLLLLNDLLVCVSVTPKSSDDFSGSERLGLKWTHPVTDIEVLDSSASPTLSRLLTASGGGSSRGGSLKSERSADGTSSSSVSSSTMSSSSVVSSSSAAAAFNTFGVDDLCQEMNALMHDYEVVSRIADLISSLKGTYTEVNLESAKRVLMAIQASIQHKDEEIAWVDSCCLQIALRGKSGKEEQLTFQTDNPAVKKEWVTELRLAQLALDPNNSSAWDIPEQERRPSTKMPLFVRALPIYKSQHQTEVTCGCFYTIMTTAYGRRRRGGMTPKLMSYLWVCTTDGASSHITVLGQGGTSGGAGGLGLSGAILGSGPLKDVGAFDLVETRVTTVEFVQSAFGGGSGELSGDTVWMGTDSRRLIIYNAHEPEKQEEVASTSLPAVAIQIKHHCDQVFVALNNGSVLLFHRGSSGDEWCLRDPQVISLGSSAVSCLLPINVCLYAAAGKVIWVLNALTGEIQKSFRVQHEHLGDVLLMAHSGVGLWVSFRNSSTICLYHTETFKHLQDISVAANVARVISSSGRGGSNAVAPGTVHVTALMACRGLLWVGTNVGVALTIPLPRLEGVPIISGRVNISHHAHCGPVTFLLPLGPRPQGPPLPHTPAEEGMRERKKTAERQPSAESTCSTNSANVPSSRSKPPGSPIAVIRRRSSPRGGEGPAAFRRASKTLPRGLGGSAWTSGCGSQDCDVYGLYGELMNVRDYEAEGDGGSGGGGAGKGKVATVVRCHSSAGTAYEKLRRSDPELAAIPAKVSTLDRRLQMKVCRPRSLDLSDWSVDSRSSSAYTSSGSEESVPVVAAPANPLSVQESSAICQKMGENTCDMDGVAGGASNTGCGGKVMVSQRQNGAIKVAEAPRTIITLMGGRGYIDWRRVRGDKLSGTRGNLLVGSGGWEAANTNDAHIVVWEMKL